MPLIESRVVPDRTVYTDSFAATTYWMSPGFVTSASTTATLFAEGKGRNVTSTTSRTFKTKPKRHLCRYNGIPREHFYYFLKECKWCFNGGSHRDLYRQLLGWVGRKGLLKWLALKNL